MKFADEQYMYIYTILYIMKMCYDDIFVRYDLLIRCNWIECY